MKKLNLIAGLILLATVTVGCSKELKVLLPKAEGKWTSASILTKMYVNSTLDSSFTLTDGSTYTFEKTGAGTRVDGSGTSRNLTWVVNPKGDIVNICYPTVSTVPCADYFVLSSTKDRQEWRVTTAGGVNGEWMEQDYLLTRAQ
jgi:hypothetical protein